MKDRPRFETIKNLCPDIDEEYIRAHLERLSDRYFRSFSIAEIQEHLYALAELSGDNPCLCRIEKRNETIIECTICAFDYPSLFSIITGLLSATGFNILSGNIFTYAKKPAPQTRNASRTRRYGAKPVVSSAETEKKRRKILDIFTGELTITASFEQWKRSFESQLRELLHIIEKDPKNGIGEAREKVQEIVSEALSRLEVDESQALFPVSIEDVKTSTDKTRLKVVSEDTPFFLFSLANALSLHNISIESVRIRTLEERVEDDFEFVDLSGKPINDDRRLNNIKLSILFTKQFTYFLGRAPDPHRALLRFETIIQDISKLSDSQVQSDILSDPKILKDLAKLLGASDFLWEDFIRLQYENILPMLHIDGEHTHFSHGPSENRETLTALIEKTNTIEEAKQKLNEFKDREIYLIDLDHILRPDIDILELSQQLTDLAELVVNTAVDISYREMTGKYGKPRTVAGLDTSFALLGLGKLGGVALGYASDIELMFIYSDNGSCAGPEQISNRDFFERLFREAVGLIEAKRQGIFRVDLRLRPFGKSGPIACSLENFCRYYSRGGDAHSFELLALVRLRCIGGDRELGRRIERLRDDMLYASSRIDMKELKTLREKQLKEKSQPGRPNAKFSPGALVDLEYTVQILQCIYGKENPALRSPRIHVALEEMKKAGILSPEETTQIIEAYHFLRRLTNSLRMLRGSAEDLFLPKVTSDEYTHLARRAGYTWKKGYSPAQILHLEFETRTAAIRKFVEQHVGRESLPGPPVGNAADLILSESLSEELQKSILEEAGFKNLSRAKKNLAILSGGEERRRLFAQLAVLVWDILKQTPDSDMALNNWERFAGSVPDIKSHLRDLLSQPKRLEIILGIFSGSQFLADTLIRFPEFFEWVSTPAIINKVRTTKEMATDLERISAYYEEHEQWLKGLRRFRLKEIMRIGTRDICLRVPERDIIEELSNLAESILQTALKRTEDELLSEEENEVYRFCILALGKLGGKELNYSSDIDLIGVYDPLPLPEYSGDTVKNKCSRIMEQLRSDLSTYSEQGYVYRVDLRLRPFGRSGDLVSSLESLLRYYTHQASLWEVQALIKVRPIAGELATGNRFLEGIKQLLLTERAPEEVFGSIIAMREQSQKRKQFQLPAGMDIKNGEGGIRDIEFLVQGLQLIYLHHHPTLFSENTLTGISLLRQAGILTPETADRLEEDYLFLRRVEHFLQIYEDRQVHTLPENEMEKNALAKRIMGGTGSSEHFFARLEEIRARVSALYSSIVNKNPLDHHSLRNGQ